MKKIIPLALLLVVVLTGCGGSYGDLEDAAKARERCHELDGVFSVHQGDYGPYYWECDLSDGAEK